MTEPEVASAPGWRSFEDAIALVRARSPQQHTRKEIARWLLNCAVAGVVRTASSNDYLEKVLDSYRRGNTGWGGLDLLMELPKARWSGVDIEAALLSEAAAPKRRRGREADWDWGPALAELEAKFPAMDQPRRFLVFELQQIIKNREEKPPPGDSVCYKRIRKYIADRTRTGRNAG